MRRMLRAAGLAAIALLAVPALAACPVGKKEGDTWCSNHSEWRCDRCGSEYCPILTGRRCAREDTDQRLSRLQVAPHGLAGIWNRRDSRPARTR
jgi:uncharacterized cupin superfamily protein